MEDIKISYGSSGKDLVVVVHPTHERPEDIEGHNPEFRSSIYIPKSNVNVVGNLLEDFFLNTHRHLTSGGFVGLRIRCRRLFGREADPNLTRFGDHFEALPAQELYPGFIRIPLEDQVAYIVSDQEGLSLGAYLPREFGQKAKDLASVA